MGDLHSLGELGDGRRPGRVAPGEEEQEVLARGDPRPPGGVLREVDEAAEGVAEAGEAAEGGLARAPAGARQLLRHLPNISQYDIIDGMQPADPLRVLMIGWEFPPRVTGGLGRACEGLVRGLLGLGCRIDLVLPRGRAGGPVRALRRPGETARRFRILRLETHLAPYRGSLYGLDLRREVLRLARQVSGIDARVTDVIHAHDWMTFPAALELRRRTGRPWIAHVHSTEFARSGDAADPFIVTVEREGLRRADRVVCVSRRTADVVRRRYGIPERRIRVVHNAIESGNAGPPFPHDRPLVLFAGRLTRQKAPSCFLEAAARVLARKPDVEFVVAGTGDRLEYLRRRARELGIEGRVAFPGFVPPDRLEELYRRASVYALPSIAEPFGLTVLEAARAGVPAIVSRKAGVHEVLSSLVPVDPGDASGLAERILFLLDAPVYRWLLARAAAEEVGRLSWRQAAGRCLEVYGEVRGSRLNPPERTAPSPTA
jgi:glycosyltransferase involved in cell wall biosynthesis